MTFKFYNHTNDMNKFIEQARSLLDIVLPSNIFESIRFVFKDGDDTNWGPGNVYYWFSNAPVECPFLPNYYYIPMHSRYAISLEGDIRRIRDNKPLRWQPFMCKRETVRGGYMSTRLKNDLGVRGTIKRHRAMLLTFRPLGFHPGLRIVNHINGIGGDDRLDNLEWCTYSQNVKHGYDTGLYQNKLRSVDCLNWITGCKKEFDSITAASTFTGLGNSTITTRLQRGNIQRYPDGWRFKSREDDWHDLNTHEKQLPNEKPIVFFNPVTSVSGWCYNSTDASNQTGVGRATIICHCNNFSSLPSSGYYFRHADSFTKWPTFTEQQIQVFKEHKDNPADGIEVYDIETNETKFFTSVNIAANYYSLSPITVSKLARYEGTRLKRYKFKLVRVREYF